MPLEEESEGSLEPDHTRQPRQEQYLQSEDMNNILCLDSSGIKIVLTFPIARRPLSKSRQTPRNRNATPNPANPTPISEIIKVSRILEIMDKYMIVDCL